MNLDALAEALTSLTGSSGSIDYMEIINTILNFIENLIAKFSA